MLSVLPLLVALSTPVHAADPGAFVRAVLEGPYVGDGTMEAVLGPEGLLGTVSPCDGFDWGVLPSPLDSFFVDWGCVELREAANGPTVGGATVLFTSLGFLMTPYGSANITFAHVPDGDYHLVLRHRNHLAVMTAAPVHLVAGTAADVDLTDAAGLYGGSVAGTEVEAGILALTAGDVTADGQVNRADRVAWVPQAGKHGVLSADVDLDAEVTHTDKYFIQDNVGRGSQVPASAGEE